MRNIYKQTAVVLGFLGFLIASWFFVHILAIFGIFLAILFPLWWLLFPKNNLCLLCRVKHDGAWCPLCQQKVSYANSVHVATLRSAILNSGIIFIFTLFSLGIIFGEGNILRLFGFPPNSPTVSFAIPTTSQHTVGEVFPMKLEISGVQVPINAVQADISFDPQKLEIAEISTEKSFATIFIQKEINNTVGYARLTGGLPNPGFSSSRGLFATVYFKAKSPGPVSVKFLPTTLVLANDGKGENVLKELGTISYLILPTSLSERTKDSSGQGVDLRVLGASTSGHDSTQMIFYDEKSVLGVGTNSLPTSSLQIPQNSPVDTLLNGLGTVDDFIVNIWNRIF